MIHRIPAYAFRVDQKPRPGKFNLEKAKALQIPPGPIYSQLQKGEIVELEDGRIFKGKGKLSFVQTRDPPHGYDYGMKSGHCLLKSDPLIKSIDGRILPWYFRVL